MRLFLDSEFLDDGRTIELISLAVVAEDGREFYAENAEADMARVCANAWLSAHVVPYLTGPRMPRAKMAAQVRAFAGGSPEWWGYFADYDWVVLCHLYGAMIDLPPEWPMYCRDLRQEMDRLRLPIGHPVERRHHALDDARWIRSTWEQYVRGES